MSKAILASALLAGTALGALAAAAKVEPEKNETFPDFVPRVLDAVSKLPDEKFEALPEAVQTYYNDCAAATNDNKPFPEPPKVKGGKAAAAEASKEAASAEEKPAKAKAQKKAAKPAPAAKKPAPKPRTKIKAKVKAKAAKAKPAAKAPKDTKKAAPTKKPAAAKANGKKDGRNVTDEIRRLVVKNPSIAADKVGEKLGIDMTVGNYNYNRYSEAKRVMEIAAEQ